MIELSRVSKRYRKGGRVVCALDGVDFSAGEGQFVCVRGASGSGKTTLLLAIGGMLRPSEGAVRVAGQDVYSLEEAARNRFRARNIGFVFQMFHLVPYLSVLENVLLAAGAGGDRNGDARGRAAELLEELGMTPRMEHLPAELSAGERQRAAIARAMVNDPRVILADEPTGNLDPDNAAHVGEQLKRFQRRGGTVVVVTHGQTLEDFADRVVKMEAGRVLDAPLATGGIGVPLEG